MTSLPISGLEHLPQGKRRELERVVEILREEFDARTAHSTQPHRRNGRILKIILYGSHARGEQVDDPVGGYFSDFDILVVVSHRDFTDETTWWSSARDRILANRSIQTTVQLIFHTMDEINQALSEGRYFFIDIVREGIPLYEYEEKRPSGAKKYQFAKPRPLDPQQAHKLASEYFERWMENARGFYEIACLGRDKRRHAAFLLHQATENAYATILLTFTLHLPKQHDIEKLRSRCEDIEPRLIEIWPRHKPYKRYFDLLRRAYVEARYSKHYRITKEELEWLTGRVEALLERVEAVCRERLAGMG